MKIIVVGAGPVGCYISYLLAKLSHDVTIYEEHEDIGLPFQCTGLLTGSFKDLIDIPKEVIENKINKIRVNSPNGDFLELNLKEEEIVLDRTKFDKFLAKKARDAGVKIKTNHRFIEFKRNVVKIKNLKTNQIIEVKSDLLIGADGPDSKVRRLINKIKVYHYIGTQATIEHEFEKERFDTFFGSEFPKFFGWIVPTSNKYARIGLASKLNPHKLLKHFMDKQYGKQFTLCGQQGGMIPIYNKNLIIKQRKIMIVGDAATQVKATTGGGIIPGMRAAKELVYLIDRKTIKNKQLKIDKELRVHATARKILNKFTNKDYNYLVKLCKNKKVKNILESESRDHSSKFAARLFIKEPKLLYFVKNLF